MLKQIVNIINEIRNEYPIIGKELDSKIYYMNGNDGTDFDWNCNDRTCEFMVFHENEMGYIRLMVNKDSSITVYVYADGAMKPTTTVTEHYDKNPLELASFLYKTFDRKNLYDKPIEEHIDAECDGTIAWELLVEEEDEEELEW